jgi:hypothetical protein
MTAKVDKKKIAILLAAVVMVIAALVLVFGGNDSISPTGNVVATNDDRVEFLNSFGWDVATSTTQTSQVRIPGEESDMFTRYNALQKSMGYDLTEYAGKTVMRYVYKVKNYPGATEPVYATILISNNQVIGGDVTDTAATGTIQGFQMPKSN